jgi:hypothetical protein
MQDLSKIPPMTKACTASAFNLLQGRILTDIETLNLPEKQENALKSILKNDIWSIWEEEMAFVPPDALEIIQRATMTYYEGEKLSRD